MSIQKVHPRMLIGLLVILVVAILRVASFYGIGPLTLFTPLGAMALFGSAHFHGWLKPLLFTLLTLFISDVFVSFAIFPELRVGLLYYGWVWTYTAFALMIIAAKFIIRDVNIKNIIIAIIAVTVIHWLVTDFGMCIQENKFSVGLYAEKLLSALPYELRFLAGTALYSAVLFGGFALLSKRYPVLQFDMGTSAG